MVLKILNVKATNLGCAGLLAAAFVLTLTAAAPWLFRSFRGSHLIEQMPGPNSTYYRLVAAARDALGSRNMWPATDANTQLQAGVISPASAYDGLRIAGMEVVTIERIYLRDLTVRSEQAFEVQATGFRRADDPHPVSVNANQATLAYVNKGISYWLIPPDHSAPDVFIDDPANPSWRAACLSFRDTHSASAAVYVPRPEYQLDVYLDGKWRASFAAWSHLGTDRATWTSAGATGMVPAYPLDVR